MDDLRRRLERLAERGSPRGAGPVLHAARGRPTWRHGLSPRQTLVAALAANLVLVAAVAGAVVTRDDGGGGRHPARHLASPETTTSTSTTSLPVVTEPPVPTTSVPTQLIAASRLRPFETCTALVRYARAKALEVVGPYGLPGSGGDVVSGVAVGTAPGGAAASGAAGSPVINQRAGAAESSAATFSRTNVQEAGVDEPDQVKTDGRRMFALERGRLWAVAVDGPPRILGSIPLETAQELLLVGDRLIALGFSATAVAGQAASARTAAPYRYEPTSRVSVIDVSRPAAMRVTKALDVDGSYVSARLANGIARIVLQSSPRGMDFQYPRDGSPEAQKEALDHNRQVVRSSSARNWVPGFRVDGGPQVAGCATSYRPPEFSGFGIVSVLTLDADHPDRSQSSSVMADGQIVYASSGRLYVASNQWGQVHDQTVEPSPRTLIHEFDITDRARASYLVSGEVRGTVLNQFSMSEHEGHLRVATTEQDPNGRGNGESHVFVLKDNAQTLGTVGHVGGLGRGERIYAVRFIGNAGYVVTFRQVDPLYTLDLSNPTRPRVVGELKLLGFSAYLHPIGPGLLLGIGQDATPEGRTKGTQVSVFDVSNLAAPRLLRQRALGQGQSPAEFDHHAFLYWEPTHLAVVPVNQYNPQFNGAIGLRADRNALDEVGRVQHPTSPEYRGPPPIERSVVVGRRLFTLSASGVLASDLNTLADRGWAPFS
jgi:hypothetical protein